MARKTRKTFNGHVFLRRKNNSKPLRPLVNCGQPRCNYTEAIIQQTSMVVVDSRAPPTFRNVSPRARDGVYPRFISFQFFFSLSVFSLLLLLSSRQRNFSRQFTRSKLFHVLVTRSEILLSRGSPVNTPPHPPPSLSRPGPSHVQFNLSYLTRCTRSGYPAGGRPEEYCQARISAFSSTSPRCQQLEHKLNAEEQAIKFIKTVYRAISVYCAVPQRLELLGKRVFRFLRFSHL